MTNSLPIYVHPITNIPLTLSENSLVDPESGQSFPIINGIPRFCPIDNYTNSFGFQWNKYRLTQIDTYSGSRQSTDRFYAETSWDPDDLDHCSVLEVGSGAGRFTEVFLRTTKGTLHSVDYSSAVEANFSTNQSYGSRLQISQASIYELPFADNTFDKIFCLGMLQHTPDFRSSVQALAKKAKPGGEIVVDFYPVKGWYTRIHSKYILRPLLRRLPKPFLLKLITLSTPMMMRAHDFLCSLRLGLLTRFLPITDLRCIPSGLSASQRREWAIMDTFDVFSPAYDNPQRLSTVCDMFSSADCSITYAGPVSLANGFAMVVRATKNHPS